MALTEAGVLVFSCLICVFITAEATITIDAPPPMQSRPLFNYGTENGDTLVTDLDSSNSIIELPFNISFFGTSYKTLHISSDGIISFDKTFGYKDGLRWWDGVRNPVYDQPFIAPFYYKGYPLHTTDVNEYQGAIFYRVIDTAKLDPSDPHYSEHKYLATYLSNYLPATVINPPAFFNTSIVVIVTWHNVAAHQSHADVCTKDSQCLGATFQAVIAANRDSSFVIFNYKEMNIPYDETYVAGVNGGYGRGWYDVIPCHGKCGHTLNFTRINELPSFKGSDLQGRFILNVGDELIVRGGCLPSEIKAGMLEVYPLEVGMFGGEKLQVSGQCQSSGSKIYCKFGDDQHITEGVMTNELRGSCPVPLMTKIGPVHVYWSVDRKNWVAENVITVVLPDKVDLSTSIPIEIKKKWYDRDAKEITIRWDKTKLSSSSDTRVQIKLLGYRETANSVEYKDLKHLGEVPNGDGHFLLHVPTNQCTSNCRDFEIGLFEIALPNTFHGDAAERVAIRYGPFPLGWYVNEQLKEDLGSNWSDNLCLEWHDRDSQHKEWTSNLLPCPCNLDQALADFGRFQPDPGCNLYAGSKCYYHTEAKHCVRSIVPTRDGAGNQCCYGKDGNLIYSQLSYQGSTPDRSHVWGATPYGKPDLVPSLSHWKHDVVSYYYCCLWNENHLCEKYMELRPTADCKKYEPPGIGFIRGDPHITTFDGQTFTFIGGGDYWLVKYDIEVSIQGRFASRPNSWDLGALAHTSSWKPKALTSLLIQNKRRGECIEIHPAPERTIRPYGLDIRVGDIRKFFFNESTLWQDFDGFSIVNNVLPNQVNNHDNFTIFLNNNIGVIVQGINGLLHVMVALPPNLKKHNVGLGLLGNFDDNIGNDFTSKTGGVSSPNTQKSKLHEDFAKSWAVDAASNESLFPFPKKAEELDPNHLYFELKDIPSLDNVQGAPSSGEVNSVCLNNDHCKYDYRITGSRDIARATLAADVAYSYVKSSIFKVDNCGLPEGLAETKHYNFSVGHEIQVMKCKEGRIKTGDGSILRCVREKLEDIEEEERKDYVDIKRDPRDHVEYVIHWEPKPSEVCSVGTSEAEIGLYIGIAVGAVAVLVVIIIVIVVIVKKRKTGKASTSKEKPTPSSRLKKEEVRDPGAAEAMLEEVKDRSPVYKPSKESLIYYAAINDLYIYIYIYI
ncbi:hypothetical protein Btru_019855 [Bulinus truncatus]|nr:hypothetical protein Btru_019855 [Bulinus truncatus]